MASELIKTESFEITKEDVLRYFDKERKCTEGEIALFIKIAKINNLNPFKREIHLVKYKSDLPAQIITGYEVYLKRAERSGKWSGMKAWTEGEHPNIVGKVEIYRKDWDKPLFHEVFFSEIAKKKLDGSYQYNWSANGMPKFMTKKVAIEQALRWAFPDEVGGLPYTDDEMGVEKKEKEEEALPVFEDKKESAFAENSPFKKPEIEIEKQEPIVVDFCDVCGCPVDSVGKFTADDIAKYSKRAFGKIVCMKCQNKGVK